MNAYNCIVLKGDPRYEEAVAAGITMPGKLLKLDSEANGTAIPGAKVLNHSTQGGEGEALFAIENPLDQGHDIDTASAVGDIIPYVAAKPGDVIFAFIDAGENITRGGFLQSAGNGNLEARTSTNKVFAVAEDSINLSGSGAVATRIAVRIL